MPRGNGVQYNSDLRPIGLQVTSFMLMLIYAVQLHGISKYTVEHTEQLDSLCIRCKCCRSNLLNVCKAHLKLVSLQGTLAF